MAHIIIYYMYDVLIVLSEPIWWFCTSDEFIVARANCLKLASFLCTIFDLLRIHRFFKAYYKLQIAHVKTLNARVKCCTARVS